MPGGIALHSFNRFSSREVWRVSVPCERVCDEETDIAVWSLTQKSRRQWRCFKSDYYCEERRRVGGMLSNCLIRIPADCHLFVALTHVDQWPWHAVTLWGHQTSPAVTYWDCRF